MFRTYDIRGVYGKDVNLQNFFVLGGALAAFSRKIVAGMDYRRNNNLLLEALFEGFDGEKTFMGVAPTPAVAFASNELGVSLTASHNPPEYNGLKPLKQKRSFYSEELADLKKEFEDRAERAKEFKARNNPIETVDSLLEGYRDSLPDFGNAVFDLAGGAVCSLKSVFPKVLFSEPDPMFVRHSAEPTADAIGTLVSESKKDNALGFAFDGDGDRCVCVDSGKIVDSGAAAAFFAVNFLQKGSRIVLTLDFQEEVFVFLEDNGFKPSYSPVGDIFVLKKAEELGADFSAEKSGHYSVFKHIPYSDGVYFSALLSQSKAGELVEFSKQFKSVFVSESIHNVTVDFRKLAELVNGLNPARVETIDGVKASFEDYTFLIRPSNTQPLVRVSVEANNREGGIEGLRIAKELVLDCKA
ncbi:MAG: hypothetical protein V1717_01845 [Candidatus Micrarchaeota archaeon]